MLNHISNTRHRLDRFVGVKDAEEAFVTSRCAEMLTDDERGRLIELIGEAWAGEHGTEPNAICRLIAELAVELHQPAHTAFIVSAMARIKAWVDHEIEQAARREWLGV